MNFFLLENYQSSDCQHFCVVHYLEGPTCSKAGMEIRMLSLRPHTQNIILKFLLGETQVKI